MNILTPGNVASLLSQTATINPFGIAVAEPLRRMSDGTIDYRTITFAELQHDSDLIASNLVAWGIKPGMRLVLMVPHSIDFIALVFAVFKSGATAILIDPGMGRKNILQCLEEIQPNGFIAIPLVHAILKFMPRRFPQAKWNVTVGRRWFWGGKTLKHLRTPLTQAVTLPLVQQRDNAAIIFTTGSTGPPKGVLYKHGNFLHQVHEIRDYYQIQPGEIDVACFPLFALFNAAMGVTTVIPQMDFTRPASVKPQNIINAVNQWRASQAFGSPALWNVVGRYCEQQKQCMPTLRRVLSAGAPVPVHVLQRMRQVIHNEGAIYTPYGATESLPVASISSQEILQETALQTAQGAGTCVGRAFPGIEWKVIRITDLPLADISQVEELPQGDIGEIMVRGAVVTEQYITSTNANALHKVADGATVWHRIGDVGYVDESNRFWMCGRKSHRVQTAQATLFTEQVEAIMNQHAKVYRSALIGIGKPGEQIPCLVAEPWPEHWPHAKTQQDSLLQELRELAAKNQLTQSLQHIFLKRQLPVDIRHNSKIFREKLVPWVESQL
jgi:olefin beta-lactone synthetase